MLYSRLPQYSPDVQKFLSFRDAAFGSREERTENDGKTSLEMDVRWDGEDRRTNFGVAAQRTTSTCNPQKSNYVDGPPDDYLTTKAGLFYVGLSYFLIGVNPTLTCIIVEHEDIHYRHDRAHAR